MGDQYVGLCLECGREFTYMVRGRRPQLCSTTCKSRRRRRLELRDKYQIELEHYEQLWSNQRGLCPICGNGLLRGRDRFAAVDHSHTTGVVRGLLCHRCNLALGQFDDDPALLLSAMRYLGVQFKDGAVASWWHVEGSRRRPRLLPVETNVSS